jgi:hypothetical protein
LPSSLTSERTASRRALPLADLLPLLVGEAGARYRLRQEWSSRTARFGRFGHGERPDRDLVVKVCDRWTASQVQATVASSHRVAALDDPAGRWRTLRFIAGTEDPPAVVSEAVDGEELKTLLRSATVDALDRLHGTMAAAGELLGRMHAALPAGDAAGSGRRGGRRVVSAGDFAVYNFLVEPGDRLVYMEPPDRERAVPRTQDVAWFLWSLHSWTPPALRRAGGLRRSFLAGYRRGVGEDGSWIPADDLRVELTLLRRRWRHFSRRADEPRAR